MEACGGVDALNAALGLCRAAIAAARKIPAAERRALDAAIGAAQDRLFDCGSALAAPGGTAWKGMPLPAAADVVALEKDMDAMNRGLAPLRSFVLPGGSAANA